ncbi:hypothetical protein ABBQ32_006640 [Trebouxia sp. C0010 RCD-2024]
MTSLSRQADVRRLQEGVGRCGPAVGSANPGAAPEERQHLRACGHKARQHSVTACGCKAQGVCTGRHSKQMLALSHNTNMCAAAVTNVRQHSPTLMPPVCTRTEAAWPVEPPFQLGAIFGLQFSLNGLVIPADWTEGHTKAPHSHIHPSGPPSGP